LFVGSVTTNGVFLDDETFRGLTQAGVWGYQISLDGPREIHDRTRVDARGRGSFVQIWRSLEMMRSTDVSFDVVIRLHVTPETYHACRTFVNDLRHAFGADARFRLFVKAVKRLGSANDHAIPTFTPAEERVLLQALYSEFRPVTEPQESSFSPCYASHANSFVIRADGAVGKCTVALNDDRNNIGRLHPDGRIQIDGRRHAPWLRGISTMDEATLACPLAGMERGPAGSSRAGLVELGMVPAGPV
jgi:uncharacterized protein